MSRALKVFLFAAIAAMTLVFAAFAWAHWDAISQLAMLEGAAKRRLIRGVFATGVWPLWTALLGVLGARQLALPGLQFAARHRRFSETAIVVAVLFFGCVQIWFAFGAAPPFGERGFMMRAVWVCLGVFTMVFGNFSAKAPPPTGPQAPAPDVWIRGVLRNGWALVLLGLVEVLMALVLPLRWLLLGVVALIVPVLLITRSQRRLVWPARPPAGA